MPAVRFDDDLTADSGGGAGLSGAAVLHDAIRHAADPTTLLDRIVQQCLDLVPAADGCSLEMRRDPVWLEYVSASGTLAD